MLRSVTCFPATLKYPDHTPVGFCANYFDGDHLPLFPFDFGLSYTRFVYQNLALASPEIRADGVLAATVDLSGTGPFAPPKSSGSTCAICTLRPFEAASPRGFAPLRLLPQLHPRKTQFLILGGYITVKNLLKLRARR